MSTISSGTTLTTALVQTGDTTGNLVIKTGASNTTALTISGVDQSLTVAGVLTTTADAVIHGITVGSGANGLNNTIVGTDAGLNLDVNSETNVLLGNQAGSIIANGYDNVAVGNQALGGLGGDIGYGNIAVGPSALPNLNSVVANGNIVVGDTAAASLGSGSNNIFIGKAAGEAITSSNGCVVIGGNTGAILDTETNRMVISDGAGNLRLFIHNTGGIGFGDQILGTSGQVLTSNGNAPPSWQSPAGGGVTSLNGQTGAITNTDFQAIGSYILGLGPNPNSAPTYSTNSTYSGGSIRVNGYTGFTLTNPQTPAGTWRALGSLTNSSAMNGNAYYGPTLFVRIS